MYRLTYAGRLSVILLFSATSWVKANAIPETIPGQIVQVIEQIPLNEFLFNFDLQTNSTETLISVCAGKNGRHGVIPYNTSAPLCWTFDDSTEVLKSTREYESVLETEADLNSHISFFLENQPDPNKGIWVSKGHTVCYSQEHEQKPRNYCLKSSDVATTEKPVLSGSDEQSSNATASYTLLAMEVLLVGGILVLLEYKLKCIRAGCKEYWTM